jgi:hypothetical protein
MPVTCIPESFLLTVIQLPSRLLQSFTNFF